MAATTDPDLSRAPWRESSYSGNGNNCVEIAAADGLAYVRDTTNRNALTEVFDNRAWQSFIARVKRDAL